MTARTPIVVIALITAPACAQHAAHWLWGVTTDDADTVVEPGETATISFAIDLFPNVGDMGISGEEITGFGFAELSAIGDVGAYQGQVVDWQMNPDLIELTGDLTTTDGVSLFNISLGQGVGNSPFTDEDPIFAFSLQWQPSIYAEYSVQYVTDTEAMYIWEGGQGYDGEVYEWPVTEGLVMFQVIPVPPSLALCAVGAATLIRRRPEARRTSRLRRG